MTQKIRLLIILDPSSALNPEDSERKLNEITVRMSKKWEIHLISSGVLSYKKLTCDYTVHRVPLISSPDSMLSRLLYLVWSTFRGVNVVKKNDIHAVMSKDGHVHLGLVAYLIGAITRRKRIIRVNEDDVLALVFFLRRLKIPMSSNETLLRIVEFVARKLESFLFVHAECIVTHGPVHYESIKRIVENVAFVPLWIDTGKFKPLPKSDVVSLRRKYMGVTDDSKILLFVGRLHPEKDVRTLLQGFRKLVEVRKDARLVIVGRGPDKGKYVELASELNINDRVRFLGYIPHQKLAEYYNLADIYVITSVWEELSNTIMEAMACGVPVVATEVGGNPYLIRNGETGLLVPPKDPEALARKLIFALDHVDEMKSMASKALLEIRRFKKDAIAERYKEVIVGTISDKHL